jgi:two-component system, response regulator PdtaR
MMESVALSDDGDMSVILTVEDEFFISEYLRLLLEQAGYEVVSTHNADDAIAILERRSDIHTIITDINMPGSMDGLRLAAAVRDRWPPIKIIVVTAHMPPNSDQLPSDSLFVAKPYSAERMIAAVSKLQ